MSGSPLISVGLPTYNRPQTLEKAIRSVLDQSYSNLELIISDNHSENPEVSEIIKRYTHLDSRIRFFRQEKNIGLALNFEFVLLKAQGQYFMWLSDDDFIEPDFIMLLSEALNKDGSSDLVIPELELFDVYGKNIVTEGSYASLSNDDPFARVRDYFRQKNKIGYFYGLYRTEVVKQFSFTTSMFGADILISACMAFSGKVTVVPRVSYTYTFGGNSLDVEQLARVIGLPKWRAPFWGFNDSLYLARYFYNHPLLKYVNSFKRSIFSVRVFFWMVKKTEAFKSCFIVLKRKTLRFLIGRPTLKNQDEP